MHIGIQCIAKVAFQIREKMINDSTNDVRINGKSSEEWGEIDPYVTHNAK